MAAFLGLLVVTALYLMVQLASLAVVALMLVYLVARAARR